MNGQVVIEKLEMIADARGWVLEPLNEALLGGMRNAHVVLTEPGAVRGNHYHRVSREIFTVVGPAQIRWREDGVVRDLLVPEGEAWRLTIPELIPHAIKNTGTKPLFLVAFNSRPHDRAHPDVVREVLLAS